MSSDKKKISKKRVGDMEIEAPQAPSVSWQSIINNAAAEGDRLRESAQKKYQQNKEALNAKRRLRYQQTKAAQASSMGLSQAGTSSQHYEGMNKLT
jgi:hypothetical protein